MLAVGVQQQFGQQRLAIAAGVAFVGTGGGFFKPICRECIVIDHIGLEGSAEAGLEQIQGIAEEFATAIGIDDHAGMAVHSGGQLHRIEKALIMVQILRADPGVLQNLVPIVLILQLPPAYIGREVLHIGNLADL